MHCFFPDRSRWVAAVLLALAATPAWACRAPPPALLIGVDEQIAAAGDVVVAKVVDATPEGFGNRTYAYRFVVQQQLAGTARTAFTLMGSNPFDGGSETTYARHANPAFWARGGGRTVNGPDCKVHPNFMVGNSYLVFLGSPATWRSFERIEAADGGFDQDDQWLKYVTSRLHDRQSAGTAQAENDRLARFIDAFQRNIARQDLEVGMGRPLASGHPSAALLERTRRLADAFDHILTEHAQVPDAEIDAALQEAATVGAQLKALPQDANR